MTSGEDLVTADAPLGVLNCRSDGNGGSWAELNGKRYYMVLEPLLVYNRNAPFAAEKWFLAGTMEQSVLLAFSDRVREVLLATLLFTLVLSVLGSLLISARLASPINHLYREVIDAQEKRPSPPVPHGHPGGGPLCRDHYPAEQGAGDQLHQVFAHHGYGQCGDRRLRAAHRHRQRVCDR